METAEGRVSTYEVKYLSTGVRRVNTDASGAQTTILINNADGTRQVTYPDGTTITMEMGPDPRQAMGMQVPVTSLFTITTPAGLKSTVTQERLVEMLDSMDVLSVTRLTDLVNDNGNLYSTAYEINRDSQTITVTASTPGGRQTTSTLDWHGRPIEESNDGLEPVRYSYNEKGHLSSVTQGNQHLTYTYDDMNRLTELMDAAGSKFQYAYNGADLLTGITMPGNQSYTFNYDANGNPISITMPNGATHSLDYNEVDLPQGYIPPENAGYQKSYNLDGAVTRLTLPSGRNVDYAYDSGGRITGLAYDSAVSTFGYNDLTNRVTSIGSTPDGISYTLAYDGPLPTQMAMSVSGAVYGNYSYRYDQKFNLIGLAAHGEGEVLLKYDADGLLTKYGDFVIKHDGPAGAISEISDSTLKLTYTYDNYGRPKSRTSSVNGITVYDLEFTYDNTGLISTRKETSDGTVHNYAYTYDANKQLTEVKRDGAEIEVYTYDANGNRKTGSAIYDIQDRLNSLDGVAYEFDADGFLSRRGGDSFQYSAQGELRQATLANGREITYAYDGLGRRAARSVVEAPVSEH